MGISATVGGLATSVYYLYGNMTVADVLPEDKDLQDALGDMKDMSAEDFVGLMRRWLDAPDSFDISDLESKYGFSTVDLVNKLAGGSSDPDDEKNVIKKTEENQPYIDDLKSVSIFSLLSGKVAFKDFMADVPTGAVLAFIPSDTVLDSAQREKLRKYSLGQLISTDEVKNQPGILTALSDLTFGGILPGVFEKNGGVYTVKEGKPQALNLLANIRFGGIFDVVTGSSDIGTELVEGGLSPIGEMKVGDFLIDLGVSKEGDELPGKLNAIFDEMQIRDLFEKDVTTNKYKFVVDRLLDRVEIGSIMGYTKKENGTWVQKSGDEETEVNGLLEYLANLNLTDVYHAFADEGTVEQKIHNFLLVFGDLSVGDILETFKYTKDENGVWKKPNGEPVQSELLKSLMDFTIEDVVGDKDSELTGKQIRLNVVAAISKLAGDDLTVAKGLGELFKLKFDEDGNPIKDENGYYLDENGESVGVFKTRLFDIKFKDLAVAFGGDKIELDAIYGVFEESLGGVTLGNVLGMTYSDGSWKNKDGGEITGIVSLLYDIRFGGVFSLVKELENSKEFSFSNVIRGFLPYASMGDIIAPLLGYSKVGEGNEVRYYDKNGGKIEDGLNTVLLLKLWQIAAGFDKNAEFNLKEEIKDVRLGDILNGKCDYDSLGETEWTIFGRTARGNLAKFFDLTLEQLLMTKSEENTRMIEETVKNISLGSVLAFALKYEEGAGDEYGTILGKDEKINGVFDAFLKWDYITYANITGDGFKNKELLREELNNQFGEFMVGETFVPFAAEKLGDGTYNFKTLEQASGLVNILFNTSYETIFNFIFSEDKDVINFIVEVLGDTTIGDVVAPVVGMKKVDDAYVLGKGEGKSLGDAISAILDTKIGRIITLLTDKNDNRTITQKLLGGKTNEEGLINLDFMLGQYVETFLGFKYNKADGKWYDKNEKEIYYPVSRLLSVNMFDLLDHLLGISQKYTADEKKDYLFGILDGIKIGDLLDPIIAKNDKLKDKQLIKLISDIVLVDTKGDENQGLVCDLLDVDKNKLDVINHYFGKIKLGYVAELFLYAKETDAKNHVWTKNDNGETYPVMLGDIFSVSVGYILDIVKNRTGEKDLAVNLVNEVFPQRRVGDLIAIIVPNFADNCQKDGIDNIWGVNKNPLPLVLSDVFDITFETVLNAVIGNQEAIDKVISITDKAFKYEEKADGRKEGRTFNDYFKNFGINDFNDGTLRTIGQTKVGEFIRGVLGKVVKDPFTGETYTTIEYLKMLVGGVAFRDVVGIAVKSVKDLNRPLILSDVIDVSFGDVFDLIDAITNNNLKGGIYKLLKKITNDDYHTLGVYLDDILRGQNAESIIKKNRGIDGLTKIKIAKLVGLILKVDGIRVNSNEGVKKFGVDSTTLDPIINYVLNLTDSVLIGDFLRNSDGSGYRLEDGKWYDDKGNACNDALNTVFNAPTSYVLYLVYGIMNPKLVSEGVKELKVGTVLMPLYNMLIPKAFAGSEMGLKDKDAEEANKEYEIKGAFSAFLTELSNKTIGGVMEDFKNNKPLEVIKNYVFDRPIGDILFDPLSKFLGEKLGLSGFACDANNVNGKGEYTTKKEPLNVIFNINVKEFLDSSDKVGFLKEKAGNLSIGAIAQIALAKLDKNADGTWANNGKNMPLIVSDLFNVKINQLLDIKNNKANLPEYLVNTICGEKRTLRHYLDDLKNDNISKITEKAVLSKLLNDPVVNVVKVVKDNKKQPTEIVKHYFGTAKLGEIAQIALAKLNKNADGTWANDGKAMKLIVSDVFNVTVNQLLEVKNNKDNLPEYLVNTICGEERTLRHYLDDLKNDNISKITEKAVLSKLLDDPIVNVVKVVKDNKKQPTEIVKHYFGTAKLGEFAQLAIKNLAVNEKNVWANGTKAMPLIVSDLFDLTVNEVGVFAKNIKNKAKIAEFAGKVTKDDKHTLNVYLEDILKKRITNKGLRELTDIKIAELVSVALKVNDFEVPASKELEKFKINLKTMDGVSKYADVINYVLNITDNVMFGYFKIKVDESGNESGIYFRIEGGKKVWYNEKGEKVSSGMSTVYSIPSSYVLFAVVALAMPGKIIEAVGDYRIGGLIQSFYNKSMTKFDSEIVGSDKKGEFTVEGSFKAVMEDVSNVTVKQIYNALLKDKNFVAKAKKMLLQRPIGDYAYDLIRVLTKGKICKGFACDATDVNGNYVISGNLADVLQATFNIKVNVMLSSFKKGVSGVKQLVKDTYKDFTVGDFTYDVFRKYAATKVRLTAGGTARDYKSNNLVLTGKMAKVFRATFNMKITEAASITKKIKVKNGVLDFVNTYYGKLSLGDVFGAVTEKLVAKKLKVTFNYDVANDYALTISGNFNEVFGAIFASSLGGLIEAYKAKKTAKYFLDEETGVIGKLPLGDILAYVCKTKSLEKQMKYTEIEKGADGKWSVKGAYETPLDIAFNKLTIGKVYKEKANFQKNILKPYFDAVKVGELMGGRYDKANDEWIKPNGEVVKDEGANGVIMKKIYMLTIEEVTNKGFKVTHILDGIYAGEILGYYYCGHYKFTTDENETRYTFCEPENSHKDYEYHVHDDGEMYSKKSEFVTALSGIKLCADATHTDENHKWHYHDKIDCTFKSHTDTTHTLGGWYKDEGGTEKVGAIENAFANVRLGHLMSGSFEFSDIVRGVKLGEAMNMVRCGGSDETCDVPDATHEHKAGVWYKLNESTNTYEASGVLLDRIADKDLGDIFDNGLNLGEAFDGVLLGDVMGYKYCNGASDCTYKDANPTHTHIASGSKKVWYVLDDKGTPDASDDVYSRATTLETILANVSMRSVIDGDFSIETQIKNVKIGELMSYEYCDGTNECLPHGSGAHAEGWYRNDSGTWTKITDNLILCVADFTITDIRKDDFGTRLSSKVKASVTVGDIFEETQTGPLSLIPSTTKVGDISAAIQDAIDNSTAIDLFNAGVLPIKSDNGANSTAPGGTLEKLDSTFDKIRPYVIAGGVDTDGSGTIGDSTLDIVITFTAEEKAKATAAETISAEDKVTYQIADGYQYDNGRKFWGSLKLEEMVDVLLSIVTATV